MEVTYGWQAVENLMLAVLLQQVQNLAYFKIRFVFELVLRLAIMGFEQPYRMKNIFNGPLGGQLALWVRYSEIMASYRAVTAKVSRAISRRKSRPTEPLFCRISFMKVG